MIFVLLANVISAHFFVGSMYARDMYLFGAFSSVFMLTIPSLLSSILPYYTHFYTRLLIKEHQAVTLGHKFGAKDINAIIKSNKFLINN